MVVEQDTLLIQPPVNATPPAENAPIFKIDVNTKKAPQARYKKVAWDLRDMEKTLLKHKGSPLLSGITIMVLAICISVVSLIELAEADMWTTFAAFLVVVLLLVFAVPFFMWGWRGKNLLKSYWPWMAKDGSSSPQQF